MLELAGRHNVMNALGAAAAAAAAGGDYSSTLSRASPSCARCPGRLNQARAERRLAH